jgi:hypothetical protein
MSQVSQVPRPGAMPTRDDAARPGVAYLLVPVLAIACALPPIREFTLGAVPWWMSNIPFWMGMFCAPGFVYLVVDWRRREQFGRLRVAWVYLSLIGAILASAWGTILLLLSILFWVFPAWSAVISCELLVRLLRDRRRGLRAQV